jgi:hypothetical protein
VKKISKKGLQDAQNQRLVSSTFYVNNVIGEVLIGGGHFDGGRLTFSNPF